MKDKLITKNYIEILAANFLLFFGFWLFNELSFTPQQGAPAFFELKDVTIGINFHWERKEVQKFKGELKIIIEGEQLTAINVISIEEYLTSVISSRNM